MTITNKWRAPSRVHPPHQSAELRHRRQRPERGSQPLQAAPQHRLVAVDHRLAQRLLDLLDRLDLRRVGAAQEDAVCLAAVTPAQWLDLARTHDRPDADAIFLSCTNTTQIEAIEDIELALGKPVVNSNQAVLWGALKRLGEKLGAPAPIPHLGRLMAL